MATLDKKRKANAEEMDVNDEASDESTIDVSFEFFDLSEIDYHALKHLISQTFSLQSVSGASHPVSSAVPPSKAKARPVPQGIDVGELADLVLGPQKEWVGDTVKCDGQESDPYAFISVVDVREHWGISSLKCLMDHLLDSLQHPSAFPTSDAASLHAQLSSLLASPPDSNTGLGLVLSERLVNMPVQVVPPLLTSLHSEIVHAQAKSAPGFNFSHLLVPSRVFVASAHVLDGVDSGVPKVGRKKKKAESPCDVATANGVDPAKDQLCLFHPEDEIISRFASHTVHYAFPASPAERDKDAFGVEQMGRLMLVELKRWPEMIKELESYLCASVDTMQVG